MVDSLMMREICTMAMYNPEQIAKIKALLNQKVIDKEPANKKNLDMVKILVQRYKDSGFLSARILNYIDSCSFVLVPREPLEELINNLPARPFEVVGIHDCYRVLPNYGNDIRRLYIYQLYKLGRSNLLEFILTQLLGTRITINKGDPNMYKEILDSEYALS